jgi:dsDNA-binding SOS-regulon protein
VEDNRRCCEYCFEYLVQREGEKDGAFAKRKHCDKSHSRLHAGDRLKKIAKERPRLINDFTAPVQFSNGRDR